jgi:hypothetical protein
MVATLLRRDGFQHHLRRRPRHREPHELVDGSFSGQLGQVETAAIFCLLVCSPPSCLEAHGVYALGEGYAKSMGINVKLFRALIILSRVCSPPA